ncbi:MAG TPA: hypothetical protein VGY57_10705 [Vicinamibacterales bacterium]|nr:hypothetical protein [Vicinamibacterales bacterium]
MSSTPDRPRLTLTGCVEHADEVKRPIASDTTLDSLMFVLIRALPSTSSPSAAARAVVGTSGTMPRTYRLDASVETLGTHVGQQVEVTGVLAETPTSPAGAGSTANLPRLLVERVKVIEPACPR